MADKTPRQMTEKLYQVIIGIPENPEDNGMIGDVKEIKTLLKEQNGRIQSNSKRIATIIGILAGAGVVGGLEVADIIHLIGG